MNIDEFEEALLHLNIKINKTQIDQLSKYYELLIEYNKVMNLTGITEQKEVYLKHFYDSATLSKIIDLSQIKTLCDVGTGAGFPGVVLKILFPHLQVTLIDSLNKRIKFLNTVIEELQLENIEAIHTRVEEYGIKNREKFDLVTARAVTSLPILLEYCIPIVKSGNYFVSMKAHIQDELGQSENAMKQLQVILEKKEHFFLPFENSERTLLKFKKIKKTNIKYPRSFREIKRKPL